ncbi:DUF459 domain-containing protein [Frankia sp. Cr2]|uniref:SGNH/GDSL hydrolase family protein n=1 Tax=Frankia sp. Cr2 TaxID=3073932 RepID=UPI002AD3C3C2|nr:DUF459 domain-containing protein [Frankia sp. Cr2]
MSEQEPTRAPKTAGNTHNNPKSRTKPDADTAATGMEHIRRPETGRTRRPPGSAPGGTVSARQAARLVVTSLSLLLVLDAAGMVHAGEGMAPGLTRTIVLGVGRPLDRITNAVGLDAIPRVLTSTFGHDRASATSSELTGAGPTAPPPPVLQAGGDESARADTADGSIPTAQPAAVSTASRAASPETSSAPPSDPAGVAAALRRPDAATPLRLLVTGDSLSDSIGPSMVNGSHGTIHADTDTHAGTGLVRPDFFDWAAQARAQVTESDPEAIVVAIGGNDAQGITLPDGSTLATGSPQWLAEYRRRAIVVMQIWSSGGKRRVYWMSLPPAREPRLNGYYHQMSEAAADAARRIPGVRFVNVSDRLSNNGAYSSYLTDDRGRTVLARSTDGVHLTLDGAAIVADIFIREINADWHVIS